MIIALGNRYGEPRSNSGRSRLRFISQKFTASRDRILDEAVYVSFHKNLQRAEIEFWTKPFTFHFTKIYSEPRSNSGRSRLRFISQKFTASRDRILDEAVYVSFHKNYSEPRSNSGRSRLRFISQKFTASRDRILDEAVYVSFHKNFQRAEIEFWTKPFTFHFTKIYGEPRSNSGRSRLRFISQKFTASRDRILDEAVYVSFHKNLQRAEIEFWTKPFTFHFTKITASRDRILDEAVYVSFHKNLQRAEIEFWTKPFTFHFTKIYSEPRSNSGRSRLRFISQKFTTSRDRILDEAVYVSFHINYIRKWMTWSRFVSAMVISRTSKVTESRYGTHSQRKKTLNSKEHIFAHCLYYLTHRQKKKAYKYVHYCSRLSASPLSSFYISLCLCLCLSVSLPLSLSLSLLSFVLFFLPFQWKKDYVLLIKTFLKIMAKIVFRDKMVKRKFSNLTLLLYKREAKLQLY